MNRARWTAVIALGYALAFTGCGGSRTVRMTTGPEIPAAQGTVKASPGQNGNTSLAVEVQHLAPPEKVASGATTYVVWAQPPGQTTPQNLGALAVDSDLRGTLDTVTPLQKFDIFITAEPSPTTLSPSNNQLFTASIQPQP